MASQAALYRGGKVDLMILESASSTCAKQASSYIGSICSQVASVMLRDCETSLIGDTSTAGCAVTSFALFNFLKRAYPMALRVMYSDAVTRGYIG